MKNRFALPPLRCFLTLPWKTSGIILALVGITALASAQVNKPILDPFERVNGEIERAADEQLSQANKNITHVPGEFSIRAPISVETPLTAPNSVNVSISQDRVNTAEQRLERLGVNARGIFDAAGVPDELLVVAGVESGFDPAVKAELARRGYKVVPGTGAFGGYEAIQYDPVRHVYWGATEMRKDGEVIGY